MAVGSVNAVARTVSDSAANKIVTPTSIMSDWVVVCSDPGTGDGDIHDPGSITRAAQKWLQIEGRGTSVQVRLRYDQAATVNTAPVIRIFGRDGNGVPQLLADADGNTDLTLTCAATDDEASDILYSVPVEVDAQACEEVLALVVTAASLTVTTNMAIMAKVK